MSIIGKAIFNAGNAIGEAVGAYRDKSAKGKIDEIANQVEPSQRGIRLPNTTLTDDQKFLLYEKHDLIGGITDLIIDALLAIPIQVRPKKNVTDANFKVKRITKKRMGIVDDFIIQPNPNDEGFHNIRKKALVDLLVIGRAALELCNTLDSDNGFAPTGNIACIYNLPTKTIYKNCDKYGNYDTEFPLVQMIDNKVVAKFRRRERIWMELRPVSHKYYGGGPIDKYAESAIDMISLERHNRKTASNDNIPSGMLTIENASNKTIKNMVQYFRNLAKGKVNVGKMAITNKKTEWTRLGETNSDMQYVENLKWLLQKAMIVWHLQPFIMGMMESPGGGKPQQQVQAFKDYCLEPIAEIESYGYTQGICRNGFGFNDVVLGFPGMEKVDRITQSAMDRTYVQQSIYTINEVRIDQGLEPVPWGNKPFSILPGASQAGQNSGDSVQNPQDPTEQSNYVLPAGIEQRLFDILEVLNIIKDEQ